MTSKCLSSCCLKPLERQDRRLLKMRNVMRIAKYGSKRRPFGTSKAAGIMALPQLDMWLQDALPLSPAKRMNFMSDADIANFALPRLVMSSMALARVAVEQPRANLSRL